MKKFAFFIVLIISLNIFAGVFGYGQGGEVNVYTSRHYDTDQKLYDEFTKLTGIKVNVIKAGEDELIERMKNEGKDTNADLFITSDVGRLHRAKILGLLQPMVTETLTRNIPASLRDRDNYWYALTVRARVLAYAPERVDITKIKTYDDLINPEWKGKILIRSSSNIYNQSLVASFIAMYGEEWAFNWSKGIVKNMAREPKGNDRAQVIAVASGEGDIAVVNTYYIGKMLFSSDKQQVNAAKKVKLYFPEKTHINVSGAGIAKYSKNKENAIKLLEFLTSKDAQKEFAEANYEYPANPEVEPSDFLKSFGEFTSQGVDLTLLGEYNSKAVELMDKAGWK
ncbi:iron(III) transport system substrate-binding protein [Marinitoga hydrogenitolerans DSM 16785]|uniref:Iron(III) transport system substrate-binding protein n=1 Tax=Marinitoga hydrogenitolerans (strain DSM 16785 / JCM 12826 / AT1271) TaxID=1122195 RepID=A0A1M4V9B5_MARH1|nr:Fe(3+) ABC transporter substrate-binding protein [Marinitoga hydrogenitolerans]SHE65581.1 iron(III) transport system substrate-binding protein [Marinitoga hydrogenitolerans DSM 16785]